MNAGANEFWGLTVNAGSVILTIEKGISHAALTSRPANVYSFRPLVVLGFGCYIKATRRDAPLRVAVIFLTAPAPPAGVGPGST